MKLVSNKLLLAAAISALLAGCDSGGINIAPENNDNSVTNPAPTNPTPTENPCASYEKAGTVRQGSFNETTGNCTYAPSFVDAGNELTEDVYLPDLENDGVHIFEGSLFVGKSYTNDADLAKAGISEGGDGTKLTVEAGATVAFPSAKQFMAINRGSQLIAIGRQDAPITFTSLSDVEGTLPSPEAVQQWGGIVINGFGITNACAYTGSVAGGDLALANECHVVAEGSEGATETRYGGINNDDSSGHLEYVVVKHTGAEVAPDNELNGITFSGVGGGTVVKNLQMYSTYDDGIEMFGGAVSFENYVALYVNDDAIDIDEGWNGSIKNALVIQSEMNGQQCIEADGVASGDKIAESEVLAVANQGINSRPMIDGLTCIISTKTGARGEGAGWRFREGIYPTIVNSMVVGSFTVDGNGSSDNFCLRLDGTTTQDALVAGTEAAMTSNIFSCQVKTKGSLASGSIEDWAEANGNLFADVTGTVDATANANSELQLLEGVPSIFTIDTANIQVNGDVVPAGFAPVERAFLGALSQGGTDWTQGWTYGLHDGSRAQPLWFEQQ